MLYEVGAIFRMMAEAHDTSQEMTGRASNQARPPTRRSSRLGAVAIPPPAPPGRAPPPTQFPRSPLPLNQPARQANETVYRWKKPTSGCHITFPPALYPHTFGTTLLSDLGLEEPPPPPPADNPTNALELPRELQEQRGAIQALAERARAQVMV